jgi:hypothetical protein
MEVVEALSDLLVTAFDDLNKKEDIRATSVHPYKLGAGDRASVGLRVDIAGCRVVLGIQTPDTKESAYV